MKFHEKMAQKKDHAQVSSDNFAKFKERTNVYIEQKKKEERLANATNIGWLNGKSRFLLLVILQFFVIICLLEIFVFRPKRTAPEVTLADYSKSHLKGIEEYRWMGKNAVQFPNLKEVETATFASVNDFPQEAIDARELQKTRVGQMRMPVEVENSIGMRMRFVPAPNNGIFRMGSPSSEQNRGEIEVQHNAYVRAHFYMGKYEITQEQWEKVRFKWEQIRKNEELLANARKLGNIPKSLIEKGLIENPSFYTMRWDKRLPVNLVTWYEAYNFTVALCVIENVKIGTYRLPLEREWEWACRAGAMTAYYFGNDSTKLRFFDAFKVNSRSRVQVVGFGLPNAFGLYNMHGNVFEWCFDVFQNYPEAPADIYAGNTRVIRGGNYLSDAGSCRSAERMRLGETSLGSVLGFRIIRTVYDGKLEQQNPFSMDSSLAEELEKLSQRITTEKAEEEAESARLIQNEQKK